MNPLTKLGWTIPETRQRDILADPIAFAREIATCLREGPFDIVLGCDIPSQVVETGDTVGRLIDHAIASGNREAIDAAREIDFEMDRYAQMEAHACGVVLGAVLEQFRQGLATYVAAMDRGLVDRDMDFLRLEGRARWTYQLPDANAAYADKGDAVQPGTVEKAAD